MTRTLLLASCFALAACADTATDAPDADTAAADPVQDSRTNARPAPTLAETAQAEASDRGAARAGVRPLSDIADPKLTKVPVTAYMDLLTGPGGNVAVFYGPEGALLVDDKFAENADEILAHVASRGGALPVYVLNTHYHGDHSGSNAAMKDVGAVIIAQDGARDLMGRDIENQLFGRTVEARPADSPQVTFSDSMTMDFGGDTIALVHVPNAHTGGDLLVQFTDADVIHMGDNFFNGMFPYVDIDAGGSLEGMIAAQNLGLRISDVDTVIIPGHGPVTDREGLQASHDRLIEIRDRMVERIEAGDTLEAVLAADIYADFGVTDGFINNERLARIAYRSLTESRP